MKEEEIEVNENLITNTSSYNNNVIQPVNEHLQSHQQYILNYVAHTSS